MTTRSIVTSLQIVQLDLTYAGGVVFAADDGRRALLSGFFALRTSAYADARRHVA